MVNSVTVLILCINEHADPSKAKNKAVKLNLCLQIWLPKKFQVKYAKLNHIGV